jgi:DNA replication protein DnaC
VTVAPWIAEMVGDLPALVRARESEDLDVIVARRRREALRVWEAPLPPLYRWARLDHPLFATRVKLERIPSAPPRARSVVLFGNAGVGKTTLAVALLRLRVEQAIAKHPFDSDDDVGSMGRRFQFMHAHRLGIAGLPGQGDPDDIRRATRAKVLVLDDLGSERVIKSSPIPEVIAERHAQELTIWITTGLSTKQIVDRYGGGVARRILEGATIVRFDAAATRSGGSLGYRG